MVQAVYSVELTLVELCRGRIQIGSILWIKSTKQPNFQRPTWCAHLQKLLKVCLAILYILTIFLTTVVDEHVNCSIETDYLDSNYKKNAMALFMTLHWHLWSKSWSIIHFKKSPQVPWEIDIWTILLQNWQNSHFSRKFKHWFWTVQSTNFGFKGAKKSVMNETTTLY